MMSSTVSENRVSPFQWNGGWFGIQLGGTLWMFLGSLAMLSVSPVAGVVFFVAFALANALGLALWARRGQLRIYTAVQVFLLGLAALSIVCVTVADWCRQIPDADAYWSMLIFPSLMVQFYLHERFGCGVSASSTALPPPH